MGNCVKLQQQAQHIMEGIDLAIDIYGALIYIYIYIYSLYMTKAEVFHKPCIKTYVCGDVTVECISNFYGSNGRHPGKWELGCNSSKCWQSMRAFCICIYICGYVYLCVFVNHPGEILPNTTQFACRQLEMINMQSRQRWTIFICISLPAFPQPSFQPPHHDHFCQAFFLAILCKNNLLRSCRSPVLSRGIKVLFPMAAASIPAPAALIAPCDAIL